MNYQTLSFEGTMQSIIVLLVLVHRVSASPLRFSCHSDICNRDGIEQYCHEGYRFCVNCEEHTCADPLLTRNCSTFCHELKEKNIKDAADILLEEKQASSCPALSSVTNGTLSSNNTYHGAKVTVHCDQGYAVVGPSTLTCTDYGRWSTEKTECKAITCGEPPHLPYGDWKPTLAQYEMGTMVELVCDGGHPLHGNTRIWCTNSSSWEPVDAGVFPVCVTFGTYWLVAFCVTLVAFLCAFVGCLYFCVPRAIERYRNVKLRKKAKLIDSHEKEEPTAPGGNMVGPVIVKEPQGANPPDSKERNSHDKSEGCTPPNNGTTNAFTNGTNTECEGLTRTAPMNKPEQETGSPGCCQAQTGDSLKNKRVILSGPTVVDASMSHTLKSIEEDGTGDCAQDEKSDEEPDERPETETKRLLSFTETHHGLPECPA